MDIQLDLQIGQTYTKNYIVKLEDTADVLGNTGVTVLSTPKMITFMEETASHIVFPLLPENYSPVGTKICVEHVRPTYVNRPVTVKATLKSIDGRKLIYDVEAFSNDELIGFGTYEQFIVNLEKFLNK